jgi:hypothetical protein
MTFPELDRALPNQMKSHAISTARMYAIMNVTLLSFREKMRSADFADKLILLEDYSFRRINSVRGFASS